MQKSVFTIAIRNKQYLEMAFALARSFFIWNKETNVKFYIATDAHRKNIPNDLNFISIIPANPITLGEGFSPKLFLDELAPTHNAMFVDADCLCVGSLEKAFLAFAGHSVSVIGADIYGGEWFGNFGDILKQFGLSKAPKFNGGVYYLEKGKLCTQVFGTARELKKNYDSIGFRRLRGHPNDEVLLSIAMAMHGQEAIPDNGDIMNSLLAGPGGVEIDVFKGHSLLKNPKSHSCYNSAYKLEEMRPKLVHFLGTDISTYPYRHEIIRLQMVCEKKWPLLAATLWASFVFSWPWKLRRGLKYMLRPIYRIFFGVRKVKSTRNFS